MIEKKNKTHVKEILHPRNKHRGLYDFDSLIKTHPSLKEFVQLNPYQNKTIDFFNPLAVKALNTALLKTDYKIEYWDFPEGHLCPGVPGRSDYIHYLSDLLATDSKPIKQKNINCLDIGTGANCIYPIIGVSEYNWNFVATDIDKNSLKSAQNIIDNNAILRDKVKLRFQDNSKKIFSGIILKNDFFDISICNPPFHKSKSAASLASKQKIENLSSKENYKPDLNFEGQSHELWCTGGEKMFIKNMIKQSKQFSDSCQWFTSLVSKKEHLNSFYDALRKINAKNVKTIEMKQGNKKSRILAWTFL